MSYILDALRKAEAERERGAVPGIHAQQYAQWSGDDRKPPYRSPLFWIALALGVALVAVLAWTLLGRGGASGKVDVAAAPVVPAVVAAPSPGPIVPATSETIPAPPSRSGSPNTAPRAAAAPKEPAVARPPAEPPAARSSTLTPAEASALRMAAARLASTPASMQAGTTATTAGSTRPAAPSSATPATGAVPAAPANDANRIYAAAELPDDVRRDLPKVTVGGSAYSNDPASRMLMVNGQIFHEGDSLGPGLVLAQIKLRAAVLAFRGYRYEIAY